MKLFKHKNVFPKFKRKYRYLNCLLVLFLIIHSYASTSVSSFENQKPFVQNKDKNHILIFISSSMPSVSLTQWFSEASFYHVPLVLRGFIHNSLQETKFWLGTFLHEQNKNFSGIEIDPVVFEAYGITQVPAVVVSKEPVQCLSDTNCRTPDFDVVFGNMSLTDAFNIIREKGNIHVTIGRKN